MGAGLPLWLPRGTQLRLKLEDFLKRIQKKYGYQQVMTPHIGGKQLYVTSGHYAKYGKDSFQPIHTPQEGEEFLLKPMNCLITVKYSNRSRVHTRTCLCVSRSSGLCTVMNKAASCTV